PFYTAWNFVVDSDSTPVHSNGFCALGDKHLGLVRQIAVLRIFPGNRLCSAGSSQLPDAILFGELVCGLDADEIVELVEGHELRFSAERRILFAQRFID